MGGWFTWVLERVGEHVPSSFLLPFPVPAAFLLVVLARKTFPGGGAAAVGKWVGE